MENTNTFNMASAVKSINSSEVSSYASKNNYRTTRHSGLEWIMVLLRLVWNFIVLGNAAANIGADAVVSTKFGRASENGHEAVVDALHDYWEQLKSAASGSSEVVLDSNDLDIISSKVAKLRADDTKLSSILTKSMLHDMLVEKKRFFSESQAK